MTITTVVQQGRLGHWAKCLAQLPTTVLWHLGLVGNLVTDRSSFLTICSSSGDKLASWLVTVSSPWLISSCPTFWGWFYGLGWTVNSEDYRKAYHDGLVGWYPVCEGEPAWFCHSWDLCLSQGTEFLRVLDLSLVGQQGLLSLIVLGR